MICCGVDGRGYETQHTFFFNEGMTFQEVDMRFAFPKYTDNNNWQLRLIQSKTQSQVS